MSTPGRPAHAPLAPREGKKTTSTVARILVVHPDYIFLKALSEHPKAKKVAPLIAQLGKEALGILSDPKIEIAAIVISPEVIQPDFVTVIRAANSHRKGVPILLLEGDAIAEWEEDQLAKLGVARVIPPELDYGSLASEFIPPSLLLDVNEVLTRASAHSEPIGQEIASEETSFIALPASKFIENFKTFFDLYVKLGAGKFVKVLKAGDSFTSERLAKYREKGLTHLFLRREDQKDYLATQDRMVGKLNSLPTVSPVVKVSQTLTLGEQVTSFLQSFPELSGEHIQYAASYVEKLTALVEELSLTRQSKLIEQMLADTSRMEHAVGVAAVGAVLSRQAGFETHKSLKIIGLACLLHDIGLSPTMNGIEHLDLEEMTAEQKKGYLSHTSRGARILQELRGIDPVVIQAVLLHHRRKDGSGFPNGTGIGLSNISLPVEVVGMADAIVRFVKREEERKSSESERQLRLEVSTFPGFSGDLIEIATSAFNLVKK